MSDDFLPFCNEVVAKARAAGLRAEVDPGGRSLGKQIKIASADKIPVFGVVGKDEVEGSTLSLKSRKVTLTSHLSPLPSPSPSPSPSPLTRTLTHTHTFTLTTQPSH